MSTTLDPAARTTLHELLSARRDELLARWAAAAQSSSPTPLSQVELVDRMPIFLSELLCALHPQAVPVPDGASASAEEHGVQRLRLGFDVAQVVREYGLLHEEVLALAGEAGVTVTATDARVLASVIYRGTCDAVSDYQQERDAQLQRQSAEHLGFIAHELRSPLSTAATAYEIVRHRQAAPSAALDTLGRAIGRLGAMIDNALSHSWLKVGAPLRGEHIELRALLEEIEREAAVEAEEKGISMTLVAEPIGIVADPRLLASAVSNLVRNALKFGRRGSEVVVRAWKHDARVLIEVEDGCGGLPPGRTEELFSPFVQKSSDRSGFGLGLAIARQAAESHNGTLKVRNLPGKGCIFTIDLPAVE